MKDFTLSLEQETWLRYELRQQSNAQVYRRAAALLAMHEGHSASEVAGLLGVTRQTVYNWLSCYGRTGETLDLEDAPRSGRPRTWTQEADRVLEEALGKVPGDFGYQASHWATPLLQKHLASILRRQFSQETIRRRLRHLGYSWSDSRYTLPLAQAAQAAPRSQTYAPKAAFIDRAAIAA